MKIYFNSRHETIIKRYSSHLKTISYLCYAYANVEICISIKTTNRRSANINLIILWITISLLTIEPTHMQGKGLSRP